MPRAVVEPAIMIENNQQPPDRRGFLRSKTEQENHQTLRALGFHEPRPLGGLWQQLKALYPSQIALKHLKKQRQWTFAELADAISDVACVLKNKGLKPTQPVMILSENSDHWLIFDQAVILAGGVSALRGTGVSAPELAMILDDISPEMIAIESTKLIDIFVSSSEKARNKIGLVVFLDLSLSAAELTRVKEVFRHAEIVTFAELLLSGQGQSRNLPLLDIHKPCTMMFTSGTGGKPKGVLLSHKNIYHQIASYGTCFNPRPGDVLLSILPPWHAYERSVELFFLSRACTLVYTDVTRLRADLASTQPHYLVVVPRILETFVQAIIKGIQKKSGIKRNFLTFSMNASLKFLHARRVTNGHVFYSVKLKKIVKSYLELFLFSLCYFLFHAVLKQKLSHALGGRVQRIMCGGAALPEIIEDLFELGGVEVLVGYGLTETSPMLTARRSWANLRGSAGHPLPKTEVKIVDPDTFVTLPQGKKGLVLARGPQVMMGYHNDAAATAKVIDSKGWFHTGDLGWLTPKRHLVLAGRLKDIIVLRNGENIDPQPIESAFLTVTDVQQVMIVGQDQRHLGALLVPYAEVLQQRLQRLGLPEGTPLNHREVVSSLLADLRRVNQARENYRADDDIKALFLLPSAFTPEEGTLTQTQKLRRHRICEIYHHEIKALFSDL